MVWFTWLRIWLGGDYRNSDGTTYLCFETHDILVINYFDGLVQDCGNSIALAMKLLLSSAKQSICHIQQPDSRLTEMAWFVLCYAVYS